MATERKKKKDIVKILDRLTAEQREFLSQLDQEERAEIFEFFSQYTSKEIVILRRVRYHKPVSEKQMEFAYEVEGGIEEIERIDPIFYDISSKLAAEEIELALIVATKYPDSFLYEPAPPPAPEPSAVPLPEVIPPCIPEKPEEMKKHPWKWRTQFPFQTSTFIQQFLTMRGSKGAYPYEVFRAYKFALWKMIVDESYRKKIVEDGGIKLDGEMIDGELTKQISRDVIGIIRACPGVHIATYTNFWKYFMVLNLLELVKKKGKRIKSDKSIFDRQLYILNKKTEKTNPKLWEIGWKRPQEMAYPLAGLGKRRYDKLKEDAKMHEVTIQEAFVREDIGYPEILDEIATIRGIDRDELTEWVVNSKYFKKG